MHNLSNQRKRLQSARPKLFKKEQFGEVVKVALVGDREYRAKALQVYICWTHLVMRRHEQVTCGVQRLVRMFASDVEHRGLCRLRISINQIHNRTLVLADNSRMRFGNKIPD